MMRQRCPNDNHGRSVITIRCCPNCGVTVNPRILAKVCSLERHAKLRRERSVFCIDCGEGLHRARAAR